MQKQIWDESPIILEKHKKMIAIKKSFDDSVEDFINSFQKQRTSAVA
jgi:hypothetical protein